MKLERVLYETRGEVALITLNRPDKLDAWTPAMAEEQAAAGTRQRAGELPRNRAARVPHLAKQRGTGRLAGKQGLAQPA